MIANANMKYQCAPRAYCAAATHGTRIIAEAWALTWISRMPWPKASSRYALHSGCCGVQYGTCTGVGHVDVSEQCAYSMVRTRHRPTARHIQQKQQVGLSRLQQHAGCGAKEAGLGVSSRIVDRRVGAAVNAASGSVQAVIGGAIHVGVVQLREIMQAVSCRVFDPLAELQLYNQGLHACTGSSVSIMASQT